MTHIHLRKMLYHILMMYSNSRMTDIHHSKH